jgi:ABC-type phosphate/phosphonate transport system ATPase subunit
VKLFAVVGRSDTGKTTLIKLLIFGMGRNLDGVPERPKKLVLSVKF